jgi:hypothetical protein
MDFVNKSVEFNEQALFLLLKVLILLKSDFVMPLDFLGFLVEFGDTALSLTKFPHDLIVSPFLDLKLLDFLIALIQRLHYFVVSFLLIIPLLRFLRILSLLLSQFILVLLYNVQICISDVVVVRLYSCILLSMFLC